MEENKMYTYGDYEPILPDDFNEEAKGNEDVTEKAEEVSTTDYEAGTDRKKTVSEDNAEKANAEDTPEAEEKETKAEEKIKIRYNHEDKEFTLEELKSLAQKGMKFDEVAEDLRLSKEIATRLGHRNITAMAAAVDANEIKKRADEYIDDGVPEKLAQRLAKEDYEREAKNIVTSNNADVHTADKGKEATADDPIKAEVAEFTKAFPGVKTIPEEVFKLKNERGLGLTAAYGVYITTKASEENKSLKQKAEVAKKAPVRSATKNGDTKQKADDPFLKGFDED